VRRFRNGPRKWQTVVSRNVSGGLTDEHIWQELSLGLVINRHCAEFFDDDLVSRELRRIWATHWLPWEISDDELEAMSHAKTD
jgi:hypothetical protein